jgi:hypothetical protein
MTILKAQQVALKVLKADASERDNELAKNDTNTIRLL